MTSISIYSKEQVDALIAEAGGGGFERVARADYGTLSGKDLMFVFFIDGYWYVELIPSEYTAVPININHYKITPDGKFNMIQFALGSADNFITNVSGSSTYSFSGNPFKLTDDNGTIKTVLDTDLIPYTNTLYIDPVNNAQNYMFFIYAK